LPQAIRMCGYIKSGQSKTASSGSMNEKSSLTSD